MKLSVADCTAMITNAGGLQKFAKLLDPSRRFESNTVLQWKKKGISAEVQLQYYEHLQELRKQLLAK